MTSERDSKDHLPLSGGDFHILLVLAERDLYGYGLLQAIRRESQGILRPDLGTLYRALARLERSGLVEECEPPANQPPSPGKQRRYYGITAIGREVLAADAARLRAALELVNTRLSAELA